MLNFRRIARDYQPVGLNHNYLNSIAIPSVISCRLSDIVRESHRLYLELNRDNIMEYRSCGIDVPDDFDSLSSGAQYDAAMSLLLHVRILLSKNFVFSSTCSTDYDLENNQFRAVRELAIALHDDWAYEVKSAGAVMGFDRIVDRGRIIMHPGLMPFDYLGFYDPDIQDEKIRQERLAWRDELQQNYIKFATRHVRGILNSGVYIYES